MKTAGIFAGILFFVLPVRAQVAMEEPGFHEHDGFFLSLSLAPMNASVDDEFLSHKYTFSGIGTLLDVRIGGTVAPNFVISGDLIGMVLSKPKVERDDGSTGSGNFDLTESTLGLGLTYYFMPVNFFVAGTVGMTRFGIASVGGITTEYTKPGVSIHFKTGKEWWVGPNWGIGVAASVGFSSVSNTVGTITEKLTGLKVGLHFNATLN